MAWPYVLLGAGCILAVLLYCRRADYRRDLANETDRRLAGGRTLYELYDDARAIVHNSLEHAAVDENTKYYLRRWQEQWGSSRRRGSIDHLRPLLDGILLGRSLQPGSQLSDELRGRIQRWMDDTDELVGEIYLWRFDRRLLRLRRVLTAAGTAFVVVAVTFVIVDNLNALRPVDGNTEVTKPPVVDRQPIVLTDIEQVRRDFGPFTVLPISSANPAPETNYPSVLLLEDNGATKASSRQIVVDPDGVDSGIWDQILVLQIVAVEVDKNYARFLTSSDKRFVVRTGQVFFIENSPERAYVIDSSGKVWVVATEQARAMLTTKGR